MAKTIKNEMIVHSERELAEMRSLCEEIAEMYRITNLSDYSGFEAKIQWEEKIPA